MNGSEKFATVTHYETLYGSGYFAHGPESASFAKDVVPQLVADFCNSLGVNAVADVGAGNGIFGKFLKKHGIRNVDIDVTQRSDHDFIFFDFSKRYQDEVVELARKCSERFPDGYLVTSFDMAEHIDLEHLPDFIYNFAEFIQTDAIISISTRPSSRANAYHSSVLPINTWKYIFSLVGLKAVPFDRLQEHRSNQQFRCDTQELLAVSAWQKYNIFQDDESHQHYLHLSRSGGILPTRNDIRNRIEAVLDISARTAKRSLLMGRDLPKLTYLVSFVQDWPFLRSFLEVWPANRVTVLIRTDFIAPAYSEIIEAYLTRVGVFYRRVETVNQAAEALEDWNCGSGDLFLTATEGLPTVLHGIASLITLDARKRGMTTVTLQHGDLIPDHHIHAAQFFIAMNEKSAFDFAHSISKPTNCTPKILGSPKQLDSIILPADSDAIAFRLRSSAKHYSKRILIGTNLHWNADDEAGFSLIDWIIRAASTYPEVLFILRPHPDDWRILGEDVFINRHNIIILDEITLLCIDWPISRVLRAVDGVISTHSTLILDALVADKPVALLPTSIPDARLAEAQQQWKRRGMILISRQDYENGIIPCEFFDSRNTISVDSPDGFGKFFSGILELVHQPDDPSILKNVIRDVETAFVRSCRDLSLDCHPHANRQMVSSKLKNFVRL